jgi:transposase
VVSLQLVDANAELWEPNISDRLWRAIEPLLPPTPPRPEGGRPRVPDRDALLGILTVLGNRMPWEELPRELGFGSGMTCWRRLREWQRAGVWPRVRYVLMSRLPEASRIDWSRASMVGTGRFSGRRSGELATRRACRALPTRATQERQGRTAS